MRSQPQQQQQRRRLRQVQAGTREQSQPGSLDGVEGLGCGKLRWAATMTKLRESAESPIEQASRQAQQTQLQLQLQEREMEKGL